MITPTELKAFNATEYFKNPDKYLVYDRSGEQIDAGDIMLRAKPNENGQCVIVSHTDGETHHFKDGKYHLSGEQSGYDLFMCLVPFTPRVVMYHDKSVVIYITEEKYKEALESVASLSKLTTPITIILDLPSDYPELTKELIKLANN
jgi:hypothetical protein